MGLPLLKFRAVYRVHGSRNKRAGLVGPSLYSRLAPLQKVPMKTARAIISHGTFSCQVYVCFNTCSGSRYTESEANDVAT